MQRKVWWMRTSCTSFSKAALLVGCLAAAPAQAQLAQLLQQSPPTALPNELMDDGQPIEAMCFEDVSADEWLDIKSCVPAEIVKLPVEPNDQWAAGKAGYSYRYKEDRSDAVSYSYYQYLGQWNGSPVVVSYASGGGTGQFSSLLSIERTGSKIRVLQGFGAGDRCNGGIVDAKINFGTLYYGQNMTPIDFLQIAEDNTHDLQPYEDLEASAASCFGVARFEDEKFVGVTLLPQPAEDTTAAPAYKYQQCFNKLYRGLLEKGKKELSIKELKEFTGEFNQVCLQDDQSR